VTPPSQRGNVDTMLARLPVDFMRAASAGIRSRGGQLLSAACGVVATGGPARRRPRFLLESLVVHNHPRKRAAFLCAEPEVAALPLDEMSEFVITASDGLWDYYSPESSVLSDTRRCMRRLEEDPQQVGAMVERSAVQMQELRQPSRRPGGALPGAQRCASEGHSLDAAPDYNSPCSAERPLP
jgi:hypothetical protein